MLDQLLLILSGVVLCSAWLIEQLPSVALEILDSHFVRVPIGNPPHTYTMLLDLQSSRIVISVSHPEVQLHSDSFEVIGSRHTDLFSLGQYTIRLPYRFGALDIDRSIQLSSQQSAAGSIGLGANSPLWRYWQNFSLTNEKLRLGDENAFLDEQAPILQNGQGFAENPATNTVAPLLVNLSIMNLLLPHQLMDEQPEQLRFRTCSNPEACPESSLVELHSQEILLLSGSSFTALDESHDGVVHLGRRFFFDTRLFCEWASGSMVISDLSNTSNDFNAIYALLLAVLMWIWLHLRLGHQPCEVLSELERMLNSLLELLIFELAFAAWLTNFFIFHWNLALDELLEGLAVYAAGFVHLSLLGGLLLAVCLYFRTRKYKFSWHSLAVTNSVFPALWSGFAQHHHVFSDVAFLLFFATTLALINGIIFTVAVMFRKQKLGLASGVATALSYAFLCVCNLVPFHKTLVVSQHLGWFIAEYLLLFLLIPTLLISMHILRHYVFICQPKETGSEELPPDGKSNATTPLDPNQTTFYFVNETVDA